MSNADPRTLVADAATNGYAIGAFNMHNEETTEALLGAAEEAASPIFLQLGRKIIPYMGLARAFEMTRVCRARSRATAWIHLDHGSLEEVEEAIRLGCDSLMYDGAHLPFEENIATTRAVVEMAHARGIPVEAELGKIPDVSAAVDWSAYMTDVDEAERFVRETGVDWLAVSVGVVHGVTEGLGAQVDIGRIRELREATGIPLVLHGVSGLPDDVIRAAVAAGIHKLNLDTDLRAAFRAGMLAAWDDPDASLEAALTAGRERMQAATVAKMRVYGCAGRSLEAAATGA
jgi:fructose-bisphosphate aldolase, class II